ncbi:antitermination protein N [Pantoea dispersa]|uniref:transcriptional antitermination N peptide n=1 Tax=Pantoea dispersa TaxID=59814 RepID=UPI0028DE7157|nr:antitermination protein N [Pantoea dispersa]MDT8853021.1 antitermination protein N [Pantoea dispersa]
MNAQERRRAARAEKQSAWKQANPLLVGVSAKPDCRPILTLNRKPVDRVVKAVDTETEYHKQILAGAAKYSGGEISSGMCLPDVAKYAAGYRKSKDIVTAR